MESWIRDALPVSPQTGRDGCLRFGCGNACLEMRNGEAALREGTALRKWKVADREIPTIVKEFLDPRLRAGLGDPNRQLPLFAGMFGGAFNPVTLSHQAFARAAAKVFDVVLVIPAPDTFLTGYKHLTEGNFSADERIAMLQLAFRDDPRILVTEPDGGRTFDTLTKLAARYEKVALSVGADSVADFPNWYRHDELLARFPVYVAPRNGVAVEGYPALPDTGAYTSYSSTEVRHRIACGEDYAEMVPPQVGEYLRSAR